MKKSILIQALGGTNWIGGLYYVKNMVFQLTLNDYIRENYEIVVYTTRENADIFHDLKEKVRIIIAKYQSGKKAKIEKLFVYLAHSIKCVFPAKKNLNKIGITSICWIPDFQHNRLPEMFSQRTIEERNKRYSNIATSGMPLILSSEDSVNDLGKFYTVRSNVYCVRFVSYISEYIRNFSESYVDSVLQKYKLRDQQYIVIMNQFWKHKNHIVALRAYEYLIKREMNNGLMLVMTGNLEDTRNPDYISEVKSIIYNSTVKDNVILLGFISREEQIAIMKKAAFVIQPSLFEGWGTVVEDAKVLDKTILLSDIPVHREQMNEKCILFDPHDPVALADLIYQESRKEHHDDVEKGIADMYKRAKEYSKGFEQLLRDLENKK